MATLMTDPSRNPDETKRSAVASKGRAEYIRLVNISDPTSFPTEEKLSAFLRASQAGHRMQSLERAASAAGDLESVLRKSINAYHQHVIFPLEEQPPEQRGSTYYYHHSAIEEPITVDFSHATPISLTDTSTAARAVDGVHILQSGIQVSLGLMFISVFVMLVSNAAGLAGLFLGLTVFCFANYAAYRVGERDVIVSPRVSLMGIYGGLGLAATMVVAAFT